MDDDDSLRRCVSSGLAILAELREADVWISWVTDPESGDRAAVFKVGAGRRSRDEVQEKIWSAGWLDLEREARGRLSLTVER